MAAPLAVILRTTTAIAIAREEQYRTTLIGKGPRGEKGDPGGNIMAIGLFTDASGLSIPGGTDAVRTAGHTVTGLGMADYFYDAAVNTAYVTAHSRTSFISTNGRGFRLARGIHYNVFQFGALADGSSNDGPAIQAGIDHVGAQGGGMLSQPAGFYATSQKINVRAMVQWLGDGLAFDARLAVPSAYGGTVMLYPAGFADDGVEFYPLMDSDTLPVVPTQQGSSGSHVSGIRFYHQGGSAGPGLDGVKVRVSMSMSRCEFHGWGGNGLHVTASVGGGDPPYGNANISLFEHLVSHDNGEHGFNFEGGDANVLCLINLNGSNNLGFGFWDNSGYTNYYTGCHADSNGAGSFRSSPTSFNATHVYTACHVEGSGDVSSHSEIGPAATIVGGTLVSVRHVYQPRIIINGSQSTLSRGSERFYDNGGSVPIMYSVGEGNNQMISRLWASQDAEGPRMTGSDRRYAIIEQYDPPLKRWTLGVQNDGPKFLTMPGTRSAPSKAFLDANSEPARLAAVEANRKHAMSVGQGFIFGDGRFTKGFSSGIFENGSTADVDPGYWRAGDVIKKPVTNAGYLAWYCATSGWYGTLPSAWAAGAPFATGLALGTKVTNGGNIYYASSWDEVVNPGGVTTTGNAPTHTSHIEVIGTDGIGWTFLCASSPLATFQNTWPVT